MKPVLAFTLILALAPVAVPPRPAAAQGAPARLDAAAELDAAGARAVAGALADALEASYVFEDKAQALAGALRARLAAGEYDGLAQPGLLAERLTGDMRAVVNDLHLRVEQGGPLQVEPAGAQDDAAGHAAWLEQMRRENWGFARVERLEGNVGYLDLRGFFPAEFAGETAAGAMAFLAGSDALVIDLRNNGGGSPTMIQLLSSYLFDEPTHLNSFAWRGRPQVEQFWTLPWVPGRRLPDTPLYLLTSGRTFSAAEEFAYNLRHLGRATLVGETTGGGAHPGDMHALGHGLSAFIPQGRAINPVTGTNWEGTGVEPHVPCAADAALDVAHAAALERLAAGATDPGHAAALRWAADGVRARRDAPRLDEAALARCVGQYGPRRVTLEAGELWYQRADRPRLRLLPLAADTFAVEGVPYFRVRFEPREGEVRRLVGLYDDGREEPSDLTP